MKTELLSTFERDAAKIVKRLKTTRTAVLVSDDGTPAAYLVDPKTYLADHERLETLEAIALGERDFAEKRTLTHAQVKKKLGKWLK